MRAIVLVSAATLMLLAGCATGQPNVTAGQQPAAISSPSASAASSASTTKPVAAHSSTSAAPSSATPAGPPPTQRTVIRPVTADGQPAAGFTVTAEAGGQLACGEHPEPSAVAVSPRIAFCLPGAEYAVACWPSGTAGQALCFRDAWSHTVARVATDRAFDTRLVRAPAQPQPLALLLSDGTRCNIRDLGAWAAPKLHPDWVGYYSCGLTRVIYGPLADRDQAGIDESTSSWTVQVTAASGTGSFSTLRVVRAYFVG
ncbi:MAG: hypothetical protein ABI418_17205, partial [Jatrophihabitantaceae bacterium]